MKKSMFFVLVVLLVLPILTSGCYWWKQVESSEVGIRLDDGVTVTTIEGSGRYTKASWYAELKVIDVSNITTEWFDESLVTNDKQPISLKLALTYRRNKASDSIEMMWDEYRTEVLDNQALTYLVHSRVPSPAKTITTKYTLDQMLGIAEGDDAVGRAFIETELFNLLNEELSKIGVVLETVQIADIGVSQSFLDSLEKKAQAQINKEIAQAEADTLTKVLEQEQAQTNISLEIADRENKVNEVLAQAYEDSPELFELRKLELLANLLDENDLVIYVPENSDIATVVGGGGVVPITQP